MNVKDNGKKPIANTSTPLKTWHDLTELQKQRYRNLCDSTYGPTCVFSSSREPMYLNDEGFLINTQVFIDLLFSSTAN
jgi:hypothetical protein